MVAGQKRKAGILMKSAYNKEIWRAIRKGKKRFFSIMLITILGVGMLTGLRAACMDLRYSADQFYDRQGLYDISVVSTLGLTEKDVDALKALDGVADAVGVYSETVHAKVNDHEVSIAVCTLNDRGINQPYVLSGRLPESADETAVTTAFADETGCGIGDVIAVDTTDDEESSLLCSRFTVTGIVVDVQDVNNAKGATAFRSGQSEDDTVFILPEAADSDIYTQVCLTVDGAAELFCYSDAYEEKVAQVTDAIETQIKENREQARYVEVTDEAKEKLADAKAEAEESFAGQSSSFPMREQSWIRAGRNFPTARRNLMRKNSRRRMVLRKREMKLPRESSRLPMAARSWMQRSSSFRKARRRWHPVSRRFRQRKRKPMHS